MLPTFSSAAGYHAGPRRKRQHEEPPWGLLFILCLSGGCLLFTRHRSLGADADAGSPRRALREESEPEQQREPMVMREDAEMSQAAQQSFNAGLHRMYVDLPPLSKPTDDALHGGWKFTPAVHDYAVKQPSAEVLSWSNPRAAIFRSFLTPQEVGHLVAVAKDNLERSKVLSDNQTEQVDDVRTSFGAWPPRDRVIDAITERIHRLVGVPQAFGEDIYVLNYKLGERYDAHHDNCMDTLSGDRVADSACKSFLQRAGGPTCGKGKGGDTCGDRVATFILYLKTPSKGGLTVFPSAAMTSQRLEAAGKGAANDGSDAWYCDQRFREEVLGVAPSPGDGVLFWDYEPGAGAGTGSFEDGSAEPAANPVLGALHSGCPVEEGQKWVRL